MFVCELILQRFFLFVVDVFFFSLKLHQSGIGGRFQALSARTFGVRPHSRPTGGQWLASRHFHLRSQRYYLMQIHLRGSSGEEAWLKSFQYDSLKLTTARGE